ncbi:MAG: S41 family peptidase [Planctomycetota bacterium]|nr:S41 family peptidase [Planctomycetota bacterium]
MAQLTENRTAQSCRKWRTIACLLAGLASLVCFNGSLSADDYFPALGRDFSTTQPRVRPLIDSQSPRFEERPPFGFDSQHNFDRQPRLDRPRELDRQPEFDRQLGLDRGYASPRAYPRDDRRETRPEFDFQPRFPQDRDGDAYRSRRNRDFNERDSHFDRSNRNPSEFNRQPQPGSRLNHDHEHPRSNDCLNRWFDTDNYGRPVRNDEFPLGGRPTTRPDLNTNDRDPWFGAPARNQDRPVPTRPAPRVDTLSKQINDKLTYRYQNPASVRFVQALPFESGVRMYQEISQLIDARHIQPQPYNLRVERALQNLSHGLNNQAFAAANQTTASATRAQTFANYVRQLLQRQTIRTAQDAASVMSTTAGVAQREFGISPSFVAVEFVHGALESHDKYSAFVPNDPRSAPSASLDDHVVGIGVEIKAVDRGLQIVKVLSGGPAAQGGLKAGDRIISVDGKQLTEQTIARAVDMIGGSEGTRVTLGINRGSQTGSVTLTRRRVEILTVNDVKFVNRDQGVAYLKLDKFGAKSSNEMDKALWTLHEQGMKSLVMDLRGNPGGLLTTAVEISNKFLPCGTIVSTRGRNASDNMKETATYEQTWNLPLVVLVDGNSASASEIFAAAIQENGRGVIVGEKSYGKGTVQTHFPLQSVSANVRITTAKFYSPKDREMAGAGVTPNVTVRLANAGGGSEEIERELMSTALRATLSDHVQQLASAHKGCNVRSPLSLNDFHQRLQDAGRIKFQDELAGSR